MNWPLRDQTCIVGIGETEYTRRGQSGKSEFRQALEAIVKAVQDAGVNMKDVDGFVTYMTDTSSAMAVSQALGVNQLRYTSLFPGGGNSACAVVHHAAMAVYSGSAEIVVCYRSLCQSGLGSGRRGQSKAGAAVTGAGAFSAPFGVMVPAQMYALQARRHMHEFGTTSRQFGAISVASYKHAQRNPRAVMYGRPLTIEDHQASRMIVDPYHLFDCCQENDGACAVVVTSAERAKTLRRKPVYIMGASQGSGRLDGDRHTRPGSTWTSAGFVEVARDLYNRAGAGPRDVDVAQFYENFTGQVLMSIEDFGFAPKGEGGPWVEGGRIEWPAGELPINTSGGNLAEAYIHGLELVVEGTRQMRDDSTCQVPDAEVALVVAGPSAPPSSALMLRR